MSNSKLSEERVVHAFLFVIYYFIQNKPINKFYHLSHYVQILSETWPSTHLQFRSVLLQIMENINTVMCMVKLHQTR